MPLTFAELLDRLHKRKLVRYEKWYKDYDDDDDDDEYHYWYYKTVDSLTKEQIDEIYAKKNCSSADYKLDLEIDIFSKYYPWSGYCRNNAGGNYSFNEKFLNHFYGHLDIIEYHNLDKKECVYDLTISLLESMEKEYTLDKVKLLKFLLKQGVDIYKDKGDLTLSPYEYCLTINDPLVTRLFNNYMC